MFLTHVFNMYHETDGKKGINFFIFYIKNFIKAATCLKTMENIQHIPF